MSVPLKWEFPGGKVNPGEDPRDALHREIREELDVVVDVGERLGRGESEVEGRHIILDVYEAQLRSGEPKAKEHRCLSE
jgi:8-oxo-dGTP diphosphatase